MSMVVWAGIGLDPDTMPADFVETMNRDIDGMICELDADVRPAVRICSPDGSERRRYLFGALMVTEVTDRDGRRVGFGIEACSERDAEQHVVAMQTLLNRYGVDAWVSVWSWSPLNTPRTAPVETFA